MACDGHTMFIAQNMKGGQLCDGQLHSVAFICTCNYNCMSDSCRVQFWLSWVWLFPNCTQIWYTNHSEFIILFPCCKV